MSDAPTVTPRRDPGVWLMKVVVALGAVGLAAQLWSIICTAPGIPWNGARLAPSFALARGLPLYALRDSGAHLGWVYGPVFPLFYLPAGLTDNPTLGLMLASVGNAGTILLPVFLLLRRATGGRQPELSLLMIVAGALLLANPVTRGAFLFMHVDALAMGWAVVAGLALHAAAERGWKPGLPLAALAVALSVASKQVSIVLLPATCAWLWREGHARLLGRWLFWLAVVCAGLAALFFRLFGAEGMLFNAWLLFSRMPWQGGWEIVGRNLRELLLSAWPWFGAAALGWVAWRRSGAAPLPQGPGALARFLLWLALFQLPLGVTASLVVDAALNSIHAMNYLLLAGLVVAGAALAAETPGRAGLRKMSCVIAVLGLLATVPPAVTSGTVWLPYRGQEDLIRLAEQHRGRIYLPWNPLTTVITERKIYPFDEALHYLWLARLEPPVAAIRAAIPSDPIVIYQEPAQSHFATRYLDKPPAPKAER